MHNYLKKGLMACIVFSSFSQSWAITDQINKSVAHQVKEYSIANYNLSFDPKNPKLNKEQVQILEEYLGEHVSIKKDIGPSHKKHPLVFLIKYIYGMDYNNLYDAQFVKFVKEKQKENGLIETGVLDPATWFSVFPQPKEWKKDTIETALSNWRSILPKHAGHKNDKMIVVNIPSQHLFLYQRTDSDYKLLLKSKIIVGKTKNQTPLKDFEIISLKFNPTWTPTDNILGRNLFNEKGELNVEWVESHGLILFDEQGNERPIEEIELIRNPRFIQPSGDDNALGNLKFETTSKDSIYLHDTNERFFFKHNTRLYSSGCIRVQDYFELAKNLSTIPEKKMLEIIEKGETKYSSIKKTPVYFDYSQVYFKDNGEPTYFPDVYMRNND